MHYIILSCVLVCPIVANNLLASLSYTITLNPSVVNLFLSDYAASNKLATVCIIKPWYQVFLDAVFEIKNLLRFKPISEAENTLTGAFPLLQPCS